MKKFKPTYLILLTLIIYTIGTISEWYIANSYFYIVCSGLTALILIIAFNSNYRTIDLTSEQNAHSQKLQSIGQLASAISHDFNNILTAIIGNSDLLISKHPLGDESFKEIYQIRSNAIRGAKLIKQLLAFVRKTSIEPVNLNIYQLLLELEPLFEQIIGKNYKVAMNLEETNKLVCVDPIQLEQVIINLVVNARDSMPDGGTISITTSLINLEANHVVENYTSPKHSNSIKKGQYIRIKVADCGTGIPEKIMLKIFDPFFSTKESSGTGLGLATVLQIINKIGGHVFVKSKLGKGTNFVLFLKTIDAEIQKTIDSAAQDIVHEINHSDYHILIVEDENPVRMFSSHALSSTGFNVVDVRTAEEALELIQVENRKFDLLLTDVSLGSMDGPTLAQIITEKIPEIKVILTSGYDESSIENTCLKKYKFLSKPYALKELIDVVSLTLINK